MEDTNYTAAVIELILLLFCSAYFSATETAFTSLNRMRVKSKADAGDKQAQKVLRLEQDYDNLLSTTLIGNNVVNIGFSAIATVMFVDLYGKYGATISTAFATIVVLIFGEITPKSLAKENPERFAVFSAPLINLLRIILTPLNFLFAKWKQLISLLFKSGGTQGITEDELVTIVDEAFVTGGIDEHQNELIQNAIGFSDIEAQDILTPRVDVKAIEADTPPEEIGALFRETGFSRLPVFEDDLDNILGILNEKDFSNLILRQGNTVTDVLRPVIYVAGSLKASELLRKLQDAKCRIAIVVDEYGGTAGIVTTEDIVEELVGEICDESDTVSGREVTLLQNGTYRVLGSANVEKMFDLFGEEPEIDATTVNGFAAIQLDKLPHAGDEFDYETGRKHFHVRVTKSDERKALELNVRVSDINKEANEKA